MAFSYSHDRQHGIDEVVLLCIGKTNTPSNYAETRNQHQVSRLVPDYDYDVIPIYNLEWYECINAKLADVDTGWGTYNNGEDDVPRVTCRPRIGSNPRMSTAGYQDVFKTGQGYNGSRPELDYCYQEYTCSPDQGGSIAPERGLYNLGVLGQCFDGTLKSYVDSQGGDSSQDLCGVHCDSQPSFVYTDNHDVGSMSFILNNGLIFTIHDPAWADKEITVVLVSAKNQRKLYGDTYWFQFADTTFDDYAAESNYRTGGHNRGLSQDDAAFYGYKDTSSPDGSDWFRYRNIGSWAAKDTQYGGYSEGGGDDVERSLYSKIFKTLISKSHTGTGGVVAAQGDIIVREKGGVDDDCPPVGNGTITAEITREAAAPYEREICDPPVDGPPSCDISTLQQGSIALETEIGCRNVMYITEEDNITPNPLTVDGTLSNITDVNFISASGDAEYVITYAGLASEMTVGQHMVSRTSREPKDDKTVGFHVDYKDENDVIDAETGQKRDRMFISAYDNETTSAGALTIMRSTDPGFVGINDIGEMAELILPETLFNIQSTGDAVTRITSRTASNKASIQLLNPYNSLDEGFEIEYSKSTARADMSMFDSTGKKTVISIDRDSKKIGLHTVTPNELLTLSRGTSDSTGAATISIEEQALDPTKTTDYGKVYVKPVEGNDSQTQSLYFKDGTGNVFDLIFNPSSDERMVYTDASYNTYVGQTPDRRDDITSSDNTGLGGGALYGITTGDRNTAVGRSAGMGLTTGDDNLFLGYRAGQSVTTGSDNIILGYHSVPPVPCGEDLQSNILIGKNLIAANCADYEFILGYTNPLLYGKLGPNPEDRHLYLYEGAPLSFQNIAKNDLLTIRPKTTDEGVESWFEKVESAGKDHPEGTIDFVFTSKGLEGEAITGMTEKKLLTLSHDAAAMTNSCSYQVSDPARPMATLKGDLNIQGTINFCDGTSIGSSDGLVYAPGNGINSSVNTDTGKTEFNLDIEELTFAESQSLSGSKTHLAVSTNNLVRQVNIDGLAAIIASGEPRITECGIGTGQNHVFTNNSTIEGSTCYTTFFGFRAGDHATAASGSNFIGYQAGSHAEGISDNAVDSCEYSNFMGYMAGYEVKNADHSVFIGSSAGYKAHNSRVSVFIGDSAGMSASSARSIGIGDNALENVTGIYNIELSTGIGGDHRFFGQGEISNALAIGTCIGGDMALKRVSIGDARINPDAVLEVKALDSEDILQEWKDYSGNVVARLTQDGNLYIKGSVTETYPSF